VDQTQTAIAWTLSKRHAMRETLDEEIECRDGSLSEGTICRRRHEARGEHQPINAHIGTAKCEIAEAAGFEFLAIRSIGLRIGQLRSKPPAATAASSASRLWK
jgi:hypothetical protein